MASLMTLSLLPFAGNAAPIKADMRLNYVVLLIFCCSLVCGYELVNVLQDEFSPLVIAAGRALLAAMVIFAFCLIARQPLRPAFRRSGKLALIGVLGFGVMWGMLSLGERQVDPELAMLLGCVVPIATLVMAALPPDPKYIWWPAWIGTAIASLGLVVVIGPARIANEPSAIYAVLMIGFGFASYALANVLAENMTKGLSPAAVGGVTMFYAAILLWGLVFLLESPNELNPSVEGWIKLFVLGVVGSALPVMLVFLLVQRAGAGFVSLYGYILPVLGIMVGWIAFGRAPETTFLVGIPITLAGVAIVQWARQRGFSALKQ
jgi:drug/metabolite transporter (DMT)-like permease